MYSNALRLANCNVCVNSTLAPTLIFPPQAANAVCYSSSKPTRRHDLFFQGHRFWLMLCTCSVAIAIGRDHFV